MNWFKKMTALISASPKISPPPTTAPALSETVLKKCEQLPAEFMCFKQANAKLKTPPRNPAVPTHNHLEHEKNAMDVNDTSNDSSADDDNLKALQRLRDQPRGTHVEARIAAIENLLSETAVFNTLKKLRWPQGVICPTCRSSNIVRRAPPANAVDQRHYYTCLNCEKSGGSGDFDDFTGLPLASMYALRQCILCWYLIGFCSIAQIAKALGISTQQVLQIATMGTELVELPDATAKSSLSERKKADSQHKKDQEQDEDYTKSESKSPFKPGYKSKK